MGKPLGRRPGPGATRAAIEAAARQAFADVGYRATIRRVAAAARVDPALVLHFFGSKHRLFVSVMELPFEPAAVFPGLLEGERSGVGSRLARFVVDLLEDEPARAVLTAMVRAAASEPEAAAMVRELITRRVLGVLASALGASDPELRAGLVGSQLVGLIMARYVVGVEPLASLAPEALVEAIAPTLQRYLTGELSSSRRT